MSHTPIDTRAMEAARYRNKKQETYLNRKMESLEMEHKMQALKINSTVGDAQQLLADINPFSTKSIIYPRGLTEDEKKAYRDLRRGSTLSMSLEEFDLKMAMLKKAKEDSMSENEEVNETFPPIISMKNHEFFAPIPKNKHTIREAFKRLNSCDIKYCDTSRQKSYPSSHFSPSRSRSRGRIASLSSSSSLYSISSDSTENGFDKQGIEPNSGSFLYNRGPVIHGRSRSVDEQTRWALQGKSLQRK